MFSYIIEYEPEWNDYNTTVECGFIAAESYEKAAATLMDYYGRSETISLKLSELESILTDDDIEREIEHRHI